ncbi:hypothetical protein [Alloscardovia criceti]|uniref:hypothetical protein n=1 Tax=Alloscardovia criceti TaxID=356828 RepID=UPI0003774FA5|nr:hypothetical protein [Alloscardovia criceti]
MTKNIENNTRNAIVKQTADAAHELAFDIYYRIGTKKETIKFHISQCVSGDIERSMCVKLSYNSCNVACLAIDIVRGRLGTSLLKTLATPQVISKLENLAHLIQNESAHRGVPWADSLCKNYPVILRVMNGFVVSPTHFHASVGLMLAGKACWANVNFRFNGRKWQCTSCDFW